MGVYRRAGVYRLPPPMGRRTGRALQLCALLAAGALLAACGEEQEHEVIEGEPVEVGELSYNVQITRFLNNEDAEDQAYLSDQPAAPAGQAYLGVFMQIENLGDSDERVPTDLELVDSRGNAYEPVPSDSPFALQPGTSIPPGGELPAPDTAAASGPIKGALLLFLVDEGISETRPVDLEIPATSGEGAVVELDI